MCTVRRQSGGVGRDDVGGFCAKEKKQKTNKTVRLEVQSGSVPVRGPRRRSNWILFVSSGGRRPGGLAFLCRPLNQNPLPHSACGAGRPRALKAIAVICVC